MHRRGALDRAVAQIAGRQHGVVTVAQVIAAGLRRGAIARRVERGWFTRMHRGVYIVGHGGPTRKARAMAAVLACGDGAVLSHQSAAYLQGFLPYPARYGEVDVTVAARTSPARPGIRVHRTAALDRRDRRFFDNIPVTSPARTLLDLAAGATPSEFEQAFDEAIYTRTVRKPQLDDLIERSAGRPGVTLLRDLWSAEAAGQRNRLEAEKRFHRLAEAAKLPKPAPNARLGRFVVDFLWPHHRVVVELDGFATHSRRQAFEADRARDGDLQAIGYAVVRVTWRQLTREAPAVVARLAAVLALSGARGA